MSWPISEHTAAILKNYRMSFNIHAVPFVEPAFAGLEAKEGCEVHGVAFLIKKSEMEALAK